MLTLIYNHFECKDVKTILKAHVNLPTAAI